MVQGGYAKDKAKDKDPLSGEVLYKDVVHYSNLGEHRTATPTDKVTALWIKNRLKHAGFEVQMQEWTTRQFYPHRTEIVINKKLKLDAFPVWWPKPTTPQGVEGVLTNDINTAKGKIYLLINKTPATFSVTSDLTSKINQAYSIGALAVVVVTYYDKTDSIASDEFIGLNAVQTTQNEWPIPVVSAMAKDRQILDSAIQNQSQVKVISIGKYDDQAVARNVVGILDRGPGSKIRVISTPYSGWFTCAGERGGGVAMFLGLAEWAAKESSNTTWIFVATSGHEIDGLGIKYFLESDLAPVVSETSSWTHLGAWQAMYNYVLENGLLVPTDQIDLRLFQYKGGETLKSAVSMYFNIPELKLTISPAIRYGELTGIAPKGYNNLFGISWGHEFHHSTQDLPFVTGPELLEPLARAYQRTLEYLINNQQ
jgi:hypothetical protein